jgi:hypothetical protein
LPKAVRKDFFAWTTPDLERVLSRLLDNMRFSEIKIHGATQTADAAAVDRIDMGQYVVNLRLQLSVRWTVQSETLLAISSSFSFCGFRQSSGAPGVTFGFSPAAFPGATHQVL